MAAAAERLTGLAAIIGAVALAVSQMWSAHEETERARIEAERAESCETDYREAMADLWRKIKEREEARGSATQDEERESL